MEEKFHSWLINAEGKVKSTGRNYSRAINILSQHYSSHTGKSIDIYKIDNEFLEKIKDCYESDGKFSNKGNEHHGLYRAAIKALYRYRIAHPTTRIEINLKRSNKKLKPIRDKKNKKRGMSLFRMIYAYIIKLFPVKKEISVSPGYYFGTRKNIYQFLLPLISDWEKEVHEKYLLDNPQCQCCKSSEFPSLLEKPVLSPKKALKQILEDFPKRKKQKILISNLENQFKSQISKGDRLSVLCRTCRKKTGESQARALSS